MVGIAVILVLNLWVAWRYAQQPIGPDEGLWLLGPTTGAMPYRDFVDCKPPGIYIWTCLLGLISNGSIPAIKFLHHMAMGLLAIPIYFMGGLGAALVYTALVQSAHLYAFQSWTDTACVPLVAIALLGDNGWLGVALLGLAVLFNVKIAPPGLVIIALRGWFAPFAVGLGVALAGAGVFYAVAPQLARDVWYSSITIPARMSVWRRLEGVKINLDWVLAPAALLMVPAIALGVASAPRLDLWLPAIVYVVINAMGRVWRPNHHAPLVAMVTASAPDVYPAAAILAAEWLGACLYLGNVWQRHYSSIAGLLAESQKVGEHLAELAAEHEGLTAWVNAFSTEIYAISGIKPEYAMTQQLEIEPVAMERRFERDQRLQTNRPDVMVIGPGAAPGKPSGYRPVAHSAHFEVWG